MRVQIGEKIKQLRNRDNRTQEMLATAIGVTSQAISRWERYILCVLNARQIRDLYRKRRNLALLL